MLMFVAGMHVPLRQPGLLSGVRRGGLAAVIAALLAPFRRYRGCAGERDAPRRDLRAPARERVGGDPAARAAGTGAARRSARADGDGPGGAGGHRCDRAAPARARAESRAARAARAACSSRSASSRSTASCACRPSPAVGSAGAAPARRSVAGRSTSVSRCSSSSGSPGWHSAAAPSVLIAGFGVGLMVAAIGGPKRLSRQVTGVAQGLMVPLFFVVLGARLDLRALGRHPSLLALAAELLVLNLVVHGAGCAPHPAAVRCRPRRDRPARRSRSGRHPGPAGAHPDERRGRRDRHRRARIARVDGSRSDPPRSRTHVEDGPGRRPTRRGTRPLTARSAPPRPALAAGLRQTIPERSRTDRSPDFAA